MPDDGDVIPVDEALRSVEWAMRQTAEVRKQRDTYRKLWEAADRAFRTYVAEVGPIIQRGPWASATESKIAKGQERVARAKAYKTAGMSVREIALQMGREDDRGEVYGESGVAYSQETVRRWLRTKQG